MPVVTLNGGVLNHAAGMLGVGAYVGRKIKGTKGYFIADGRMHPVVVGLSLLGTYLSALTVMGLPGMAYGKHDWTYMVQLPFLILTAVIITRIVLPRYRAAGVISIYTYLEERIDVTARVLASIAFLIFSIARMGLVLYLPALAFSVVTGAPLWLCVVGMGLIITGIISFCLAIVATSKLWFPHLWKKNSTHARHKQHTSNHPTMRDRAFRERN